MRTIFVHRLDLTNQELCDLVNEFCEEHGESDYQGLRVNIYDMSDEDILLLSMTIPNYRAVTV